MRVGVIEASHDGMQLDRDTQRLGSCSGLCTWVDGGVISTMNRRGPFLDLMELAFL